MELTKKVVPSMELTNIGVIGTPVRGLDVGVGRTATVDVKLGVVVACRAQVAEAMCAVVRARVTVGVATTGELACS